LIAIALLLCNSCSNTGAQSNATEPDEDFAATIFTRGLEFGEPTQRTLNYWLGAQEAIDHCETLRVDLINFDAKTLAVSCEQSGRPLVHTQYFLDGKWGVLPLTGPSNHDRVRTVEAGQSLKIEFERPQSGVPSRCLIEVTDSDAAHFRFALLAKFELTRASRVEMQTEFPQVQFIPYEMQLSLPAFEAMSFNYHDWQDPIKVDRLPIIVDEAIPKDGQGRRALDVTIVNTTGFELQFSASGSSPMRRLDYWREAAWVCGPWPKCGTGYWPVWVAPDAEFTFKFDGGAPRSAWREVVCFSVSGSNSCAMHLVASEGV